jgi:environmental stress-induced protein Ves
MSLSLLRAADRAAVPWKNGGGLTREVAAGPAGSGLDDFDWRISLAEVREPGPFSRFDGIDRGFAVLDGRIRLAVDDREPITLSVGDPIHAFPGEASCFATPLDGPTHDLNVMTRRGRAQAHAVRLTVETQASIALSSDLVVLVAAQGPVAVTARGEQLKLVERDAVLAQDMMGDRLDLLTTSRSTVLVISLDVGSFVVAGGMA